MADDSGSPVLVVLTTSIVAFVSGFMLGVYSIRGSLMSPALAEERRRNREDPVESDESDVDEGDTVLDHAPNWANGAEADLRDGLRATAAGQGKQQKKKSKAAAGAATAAAPAPAVQDSREECKLVLVVRTDLGMTKGSFPSLSFPPSTTQKTSAQGPTKANEPASLIFQARSQRNARTPPSHATRPSRVPRTAKARTRLRRACWRAGSGTGRPRSRCRPRARTR